MIGTKRIGDSPRTRVISRAFRSYQRRNASLTLIAPRVQAKSPRIQPINVNTVSYQR